MAGNEQRDEGDALYEEAKAIFDAAKADFEAIARTRRDHIAKGDELSPEEVLNEQRARARLFLARVRLSKYSREHGPH